MDRKYREECVIGLQYTVKWMLFFINDACLKRGFVRYFERLKTTVSPEPAVDKEKSTKIGFLG
jgi:hypothetical protein